MTDPRFISGISPIGTYGGWTPTMHGGLMAIPGLESLLGSGTSAALVSQQLHAMMAPWMASGGRFMPGQFSPVQNVYDQMQARHFMSLQQQAAAQGRAQDTAHLQGSLVRMYEMFQKEPATAEQRRFLGDMSGMAVQHILPVLAQVMPGAADSLFGSRGSASLMAMGVAQGGRHLADARGVTGGLTGQQLGILSGELFTRLYGPGSEGAAGMRGLGGAATGQLFSEMAQRGMLGTAAGGTGRDDGVLAGATDIGGGMGPVLRKFDAKKIAARVKEMAGAVSAMRDLFGDLGRSDAPMAELINGLEALTQGGLQRIDRTRLENMVRQTKETAKMTGVGMDMVFGMQAAAGQMAEGMGLDRSFVPDAVRQSMSFAAAFGQTSAGDVPGWKRLNKEQMMALDQRLRLQAASSDMANQLGALGRLGDQGVLAKGSKAEALYQKVIKGGDLSGYDYMAPGDFAEMLSKEGGVSQAAATAALAETAVNQEFVFKYDLAGKIRSKQRDTDFRGILQSALEQGALGVLPSAPDGSDAATKEAFAARQAAITTAMSSSLLDMKPEDLYDPKKRIEAMAKGAAASFKTPAERTLALGTDDLEKQNRILREAAATGFASFDQAVQTTPGLSQYISGTNAIAAHSTDTMRRFEQIEAQTAARASLSKAMSGLGQQGPLRRLVEALGTGGPDVDLGDMFRQFLGAVPSKEVLGALTGPLKELGATRSRLEKMGRELEALPTAKGMTDDQRKKRKEAILGEMSTLEAKAAELTGGKDMAWVDSTAASLGVTVDELLQGKSASTGKPIDETAVRMARERSGLAARLRAEGFADPEVHAAARSHARAGLVADARKGAGSGAAIEAADRTRRWLIDVGRAQGRAGFIDKKSDADVADRDIDQLLALAAEGKLQGAAGKKSIESLLGADVVKALVGKEVSLSEYRQDVAQDKDYREAREMVVRGELHLLDDRRARIAATGMPALAPTTTTAPPTAPPSPGKAK